MQITDSQRWYLPTQNQSDREYLVTRNWFTWRRLGWSPAANVARTTLHATYTPRFWQKLDGLYEFQNQDNNFAEHCEGYH